MAAPDPPAGATVSSMAPASAGSSGLLGVLGGSGLYQLEGLADVSERWVDTPFGAPSGPLVFGRVGACRLVFLARHGRGHVLGPSEINYRANIHALKHAGVERLLAISAVGSLREGIVPGDLVLVDQFIDKTFRRESSFFGGGVVGHVAFADPVCPDLGAAAAAAAAAAGCALAAASERHAAPPAGALPRLHRGATYVCMEGPQFSTRAESHLHRSWGADVVGMTAVTEAKLAREAEMCFAVLALSTDYDCWHPAEEAVTAESVVKVLLANVARAKHVVRELAARLPAARACSCGAAAAGALLTDKEAISPEARRRLHTLFGRYL
jgi:5'-methylthioadenosine phosphorylase